MINANRNLAAYEPSACRCGPTHRSGRLRRPAGGFPHRPGALRNALPGHRALRHAAVSRRPGRAAGRGLCPARGAEIAMAAAPEEDGQLRPQPVFCLLGASCWKAWCASPMAAAARSTPGRRSTKPCTVPFDKPGDDAHGLLQRQHPGRAAPTRIAPSVKSLARSRRNCKATTRKRYRAGQVLDFLSRLVAALSRTPKSVALPLFEALGRVLAEDVVSPFDVPPHDNSAMDGYAFDGAPVDAGCGAGTAGGGRHGAGGQGLARQRASRASA
jgi:hypothetical protein